MYKNKRKVLIKILQGSVVTQTVLDRSTMYPPVANFLHCMHGCLVWRIKTFIYVPKTESWWAADTVIAK